MPSQSPNPALFLPCQKNLFYLSIISDKNQQDLTMDLVPQQAFLELTDADAVVLDHIRNLQVAQ
jgi:hypothetical protein